MPRGKLKDVTEEHQQPINKACSNPECIEQSPVFTRNGTCKDGITPKWRSECKTCFNAKVRKRDAARQLTAARPCATCGLLTSDFRSPSQADCEPCRGKKRRVEAGEVRDIAVMPPYAAFGAKVSNTWLHAGSPRGQGGPVGATRVLLEVLQALRSRLL